MAQSQPPQAASSSSSPAAALAAKCSSNRATAEGRFETLSAQRRLFCRVECSKNGGEIVPSLPHASVRRTLQTLQTLVEKSDNSMAFFTGTEGKPAAPVLLPNGIWDVLRKTGDVPRTRAAAKAAKSKRSSLSSSPSSTASAATPSRQLAPFHCVLSLFDVPELNSDASLSSLLISMLYVIAKQMPTEGDLEVMSRIEPVREWAVNIKKQCEVVDKIFDEGKETWEKHYEASELQENTSNSTGDAKDTPSSGSAAIATDATTTAASLDTDAAGGESEEGKATAAAAAAAAAAAPSGAATAAETATAASGSDAADGSESGAVSKSSSIEDLSKVYDTWKQDISPMLATAAEKILKSIVNIQPIPTVTAAQVQNLVGKALWEKSSRADYEMIVKTLHHLVGNGVNRSLIRKCLLKQTQALGDVVHLSLKGLGQEAQTVARTLGGKAPTSDSSMAVDSPSTATDASIEAARDVKLQRLMVMSQPHCSPRKFSASLDCLYGLWSTLQPKSRTPATPATPALPVAASSSTDAAEPTTPASNSTGAAPMDAEQTTELTAELGAAEQGTEVPAEQDKKDAIEYFADTKQVLESMVAKSKKWTAGDEWMTDTVCVDLAKMMQRITGSMNGVKKYIDELYTPNECDHTLLYHQLRSSLRLESLWQALDQCMEQLRPVDPDNQKVLLLSPIIKSFFVWHRKLKLTTLTADKGKRTLSRSGTQQGNMMAESDQVASAPPTPVTPAPTAAAAAGESGSASAAPMAVDGAPKPQDDYLVDVAERATQQRFAQFIERNRSVLNALVRKDPGLLSSKGPFNMLIEHYPHVIDFRIREEYFRKKLLRATHDSQQRRYGRLSMRVRRDNLFQDSYQQLQRFGAEELKGTIEVVFHGEEGIDAGGLLREWNYKLSHEMMNANYALFVQSNLGSETYMPNPQSSINPEHLGYFRFCGRVVAKAIFDNQLLDCHFTRAFYKQILGVPVSWRDMEAVDEGEYKNLCWILDNDITPMEGDYTFSVDRDMFGKMETFDLKPDGSKINVTEANKKEYVRLLCLSKLTEAIKEQIAAFKTGFHEIVKQEDIAIFNEQELEMIISGLPEVDIEDLKANTEYGTGYTLSSMQIQWFWRAVRSFEREERLKLVQFVTGTGKIPVGGFAKLVGMSGPQKFNIHKDRNGPTRLPQAHTCFNQLDLPEYETYDQLRSSVLLAITEGSEGFGFG